MKLGKFELNGGVRYERSSGSRRTGLGVTIPAEYSDNLFSYRIGLVYKPVEAVTLYAAYGNSKTPSQSSVNGACSLPNRSEEHTSELQSLMRISYAVFCLKKKNKSHTHIDD